MTYTLKTTTDKGAQYFSGFGQFGKVCYSSFRRGAKEFKSNSGAVSVMNELSRTTKLKWVCVKDANNYSEVQIK